MPRKMNNTILIICAIVLGVWFGCSEESTGPKCDDKFEGILEVDYECNILGGDTTDFQPRPQWDPHTLEVLNHSLIYACPNPVEGYFTVIKFQIPRRDSVSIFLYDRPCRGPVDTICSRVLDKGVYAYSVMHNYVPGIYRVKMYTAGGFASYGDIEFLEKVNGE
jgi:hypothetical protein